MTSILGSKYIKHCCEIDLLSTKIRQCGIHKSKPKPKRSQPASTSPSFLKSGSLHHPGLFPQHATQRCVGGRVTEATRCCDSGWVIEAKTALTLNLNTHVELTYKTAKWALHSVLPAYLDPYPQNGLILFQSIFEWFGRLGKDYPLIGLQVPWCEELVQCTSF